MSQPSIPLYPTVTDANGALIQFQGVQKTRAYPMPAGTIILLPTDGTIFTVPTRCIIADKAGTATVTDLQGNTISSFPLTGGEQYLALTAISNLSTTTKVWGLY